MSLTPMLDYITNYWLKLIRRHEQDDGTLIGLPRPYIVPSHEGFFQEAMHIREKWYSNCEKVFWTTGCLWEKYNVVAVGQIPERGVYGSIRGFGWSNTVTWDFADRLGK